MLELRIISGAQTMPIFDLPAAMGRSKAAREIGDTIEGLMAFLDDLSGDPDLEDGGDDEPDESETDQAWIERIDQSAHPRPIATDFAGRWNTDIAHEDDEDDDPTEDDDSDRCAAGDDLMIAGPAYDREQWDRYGRDSVFGHEDAEENGDLELNGDERDYSS